MNTGQKVSQDTDPRIKSLIISQQRSIQTLELKLRIERRKSADLEAKLSAMKLKMKMGE